MPITFDSLDELKDFYRNFKLSEERAATASAATTLAAPQKNQVQEKRKPGRPPKVEKIGGVSPKTEKKAATKQATAKTAKPSVKSLPKKAVKSAAKKGQPVKQAKAVVGKAGTAKNGKVKPDAVQEKRPKGRPKAAGTLTSKIQDTIQKFLNNRREFTANDIFEDLSKREKDVNKQSVITSVLKQMNSSFSNVKVTERPGAGPRPVKVYIP
jgi:hypothetical protein